MCVLFCAVPAPLASALYPESKCVLTHGSSECASLKHTHTLIHSMPANHPMPELPAARRERYVLLRNTQHDSFNHALFAFCLIQAAMPELHAARTARSLLLRNTHTHTVIYNKCFAGCNARATRSTQGTLLGTGPASTRCAGAGRGAKHRSVL